MSGGLRLLLLVAGAAAAVVLFVVFRGSDDETPTTTPPPPPPAAMEILVPMNIDAVTRRTIPRGRQVVLVVSGGPAEEEVHLHGYDVKRRIGPDGIARLPFRATIPGRFEVELEASHRQVADLTVR